MSEVSVTLETPGKVHVATVWVKGNGLEAVYEPLGHALAPLEVDILSFVQQANWLNATRYNGRMMQIQFVDLLMKYLPTPSFGLSVQAEDGGRIERIKVYAAEEAYWKSVYAHPDFLSHVWNSGLPVRF